MTLTNPGAISNSGAKKFTNQFGTIAKINWNKQQNDDEYQAFQNYTWYAIHNVKRHQPYCGDCNSVSSSKSNLKLKPSKKNSSTISIKKIKKDKKDKKESKQESKHEKKDKKDKKEKHDHKHSKKSHSNPILRWIQRFF